ncbi:hypothetical protein PROFUN_15622 [Planoprotostelium fungivorum]|uniref:Uncharacterized protein n=1 Tax=Planoprotostelium fungivorum TaxID=1890364 RepID=A0A2P6MVG4_9EUKA|nr:hypothetical protein PROFUN_15622 [Planoprotostelium fungivorum]
MGRQASVKNYFNVTNSSAQNVDPDAMDESSAKAEDSEPNVSVTRKRRRSEEKSEAQAKKSKKDDDEDTSVVKPRRGRSKTVEAAKSTTEDEEKKQEKEKKEKKQEKERKEKKQEDEKKEERPKRGRPRKVVPVEVEEGEEEGEGNEGEGKEEEGEKEEVEGPRTRSGRSTKRAAPKKRAPRAKPSPKKKVESEEEGEEGEEEEEEKEETKTPKKKGRKYIKKGQPGYVRPKYYYVAKGPRKSKIAPVLMSRDIEPDVYKEEDVMLRHWSHQQSQTVELSDHVIDGYLPSSTSIHVSTDEESHTLPLFSVLHDRINLSMEEDSDLNNRFIINAGAPVWAMDWCPHPHGIESPHYLALSTHKHMDERHILGKMYTGGYFIQLWNMGSLTGKEKARLELCIVHNGGCIWDLKWCPKAYVPKDRPNSRLGILAIASADGSISVYTLPHLESTESNDEPKFVSMSPSFFFGNNEFSPISSPAVTLCWSSYAPSLAVGYGDGTIRVWDLDRVIPSSHQATSRDYIEVGDIEDKLFPFAQFKGHGRMVNRISWSNCDPNWMSSSSIDGHFKIWDLRNPFHPIYDHVPGGGNINAVLWSIPQQRNIFGKLGPILAMEDGTVRFLATRSVHVMPRVYDVDGSPPLWDIDVSDAQCVATAATDGSIISFSFLDWVSKYPKRGGIKLIEMNRKEDTIHITCPLKPAESNADPMLLYDTQLSMHRVKWNTCTDRHNWLAAAGGAGLVVVLELSTDVLKYGPVHKKKNKPKKGKKTKAKQEEDDDDDDDEE